VANLGLVLYLFLVGVELDPEVGGWEEGRERGREGGREGFHPGIDLGHLSLSLFNPPFPLPPPSSLSSSLLLSSTFGVEKGEWRVRPSVRRRGWDPSLSSSDFTRSLIHPSLPPSPQVLRRNGQKAVSIAVVGIALPFGLGCLISPLLFNKLLLKDPG